MRSKSYIMDYIWLGIFGIGAIVIFMAEFLSADIQTNQYTAIPYKFLELFLSIGFGWILQRVGLRRETQDELKQFALSAFRRITDIGKSVIRINETISHMRPAYPEDKIHELDILQSIAVEMNDAINSSIADWADIIGEEISKKEKLDELQQEKMALTQQKQSEDTEQTAQRIGELSREIDKLRSSLPYLLRSDIVNYQQAEDSFPREGRRVEIVIDHYQQEAKLHSCITLRVDPFIDIRAKAKLDNIMLEKPYSIRIDQGMGQQHALICDKNGHEFGEVKNPLPSIYKNDYVVSLLTVISAITKNASIDEPKDLFTPINLGLVELEGLPTAPRGELLVRIPASELDFTRG
jgi:hypothetical protein